MNLEPEKDKFIPNQLNSKARYCSKVSPRLQRIPDPSFIFPQEELSGRLVRIKVLDLKVLWK